MSPQIEIFNDFCVIYKSILQEHGAAYEAGGLEVGQLILAVDGHRVEGMQHQDVARLIAESFAQRDKPVSKISVANCYDTHTNSS